MDAALQDPPQHWPKLIAMHSNTEANGVGKVLPRGLEPETHHEGERKGEAETLTAA
ncbi:MAG TPA: hypothetical protein P5114_04735 [Hyphomicrobiaceae bacterium]|nr:hypothetical protein [Hyphomicrobiaceae bacterium]